MPLITIKAMYPYEYRDSWKKLEQNQLPPKECFYGSLNESNISDVDYEHACKVWNYFSVQNLVDTVIYI